MPNRFTVVLDTNVLFGGLHRNIALSLAEADLYRPKWSTQTCDELERVLSERISPEKSKLQVSRINRAFPDASLTPKQALIEASELPDPDDRHVLATAIQSRAALIATDNLKDFPHEKLEIYEVSAVSADQFFSDCITVSELTAVAQMRALRHRLNSPKLDSSGLLLRMEQVGLPQTADVLSKYSELL